jgi:hypothetical protein
MKVFSKTTDRPKAPNDTITPLESMTADGAPD